MESRHSSDCSTISRLLKKWKTKSGQLAAERRSGRGRVLPGSSAISLLSELRPVAHGSRWRDVILALQAFAWQPSALNRLSDLTWEVFDPSEPCQCTGGMNYICVLHAGLPGDTSQHAAKIHFEGFVLCCLQRVCPYHVNKSGSNYNRTLFSTRSRCHGAERSN